MGSLHSNVHFSVRLTHEPCLQHCVKRSCTWKRARRIFRSQTSFWTLSASKKARRTPAGCVVCRNVKRRPREDATDPVFYNSIPGTPKRLLPDDERREPRERREQPLKPRRVYIRNSVELARCGYTLGRIGCCIIRSCAGREITQAMSSDADLSARVREAHERMLRSVADAEPNHGKKVRFAEQTIVPVSPAVSTSHTVSAPVAHGESSSSAPPRVTPIVEHVRPTDSDEHSGSKKLKLSELGNLPSGAPTSAGVNLSSDDMRAECLLERYERERVANTSNDPVLS